MVSPMDPHPFLLSNLPPERRFTSAEDTTRESRDRRGMLRETTMNTRLLMTMQINVGTPQNIGEVPHGTRRTAPIGGGTFEGPRLRGTVLPAGSADWLLLRSDGVLELELRCTLRTDDGA